MAFKRVHFVEDGNDWIIFFCDTIRYKRINNNEKICFEYILDGKTESVYYEDVDEFDKSLYSKCLFELTDNGESAEERPEDDIEITLNVANVCNMNCGYCYANGGVYHSKENLMTVEIAQLAIDLFIRKYHRIGNIKFIGGEPLLNRKVIFFVCDYVLKKYQDEAIPYMPTFTVVTNGTILDDEIINYTIKYDWIVGISFDGPDSIHDLVRKFKDGRSSVSIIKENIKKWQDATNGRSPYSVNACYSGIHQQNGVSIIDAVKYMRDEMGFRKVNIIPIDASKDSSFSLINEGCFVNAAKEIYSRESDTYRKYIFEKLVFVEKMLKAHSSMSKHMCKAGITTFGVSSTGLISPCHLLTDENGFNMGSVYDKDLESENFYLVHDKLMKYNRYEHPVCSECFANRICINCLGGNFFRTGNAFIPDTSVCQMLRGSVEEILKDLTKMEYK